MTLLQTVYESTPMASLLFLFVQLPVFLLMFYLVPARWRPAVLLLISLFMLYQNRGAAVCLLFIGMIALDLAAAILSDRYEQRKRVRLGCLWFVAVKGVALLAVSGALIQMRYGPMLLAVQIYALSSIDRALEVYRGDGPPHHDPIRYALYCTFFPRLLCGPLVAYGDFAPQIRDLRLDLTRAIPGLGRFVQGMFKADVLGGELYRLYLSLGRLPEPTILSGCFEVFSFALALYYCLSGCSEMARGLAEAFGFSLPQNFYYPYQSRNMGDFLERFNMTVADFLDRTVYRGLGGDKNGRLADTLNTLVVGMLLGLWFGLRLNYLLWGAYLALFVIGERYLYPKVVERVPTLFARLLTLAAVLLGLPLFMGDSPAGALAIYRAFGDMSLPFNDQLLYLLSSNWLLILLSCFFATNATSLLLGMFRRGAPRLSLWVLGALDAGVLALYVALTL